MTETRYVPSYCYNCVAGPDPMKIKVEDGVACEVVPNFDLEEAHPGNGRVCVKALGLVQKTYNPHRITTPMKRTNPVKGRDQDPGFEPISWDEAFDLISEKLLALRDKGLTDDRGLPRFAATFGHGGTPSAYMGTLPAFLASWGPIDFSFGSGQGVKCVHSEHLYGEYWHRAFTVCSDTPNTRYILSFGFNAESSGGPAAARRHADARARGVKRVQVEPHLSITGGASSEWVPIKPKTDLAFMFGLIHVMLHQQSRDRLDIPYLRDSTSSPYLVGPEGYYLRDVENGEPLVWDEAKGCAVPHNTPGVVPALEGTFTVASAVEHGPDEDRYEYTDVKGTTAFSMMVESMAPYTPEWAEALCDVPAETMVRIANEYLDHACVGETIEVDGETLPFRPVSVVLGKTVNNGWGAYHCVWARTVLAVLVGALEVPGGTIGTTVRLNRPFGNRLGSVQPGEDGFMVSAMNATDKEGWESSPTGRNAHKALVPIVNSGAWSQALGPTQLAWMFLNDAPSDWMRSTFPEVWFLYRSNPAISFWDSKQMVDIMAKMPFTVAFAYTADESNHMADILLPDATDLESLQLIHAGGTKFVEQIWEHEGVMLRQPAVAPQGEARDMTWIATQLAKRTGLQEKYYNAINRGAGGMPLKGEGFDYSLDPSREHSVEEVWDAACKAASSSYSEGKEVRDLEWFKEQGHYMVPYAREDWYLYPTLKSKGLRFELPYQERLKRVGEELKRRLHEQDVHWWDDQLEEYEALPQWDDVQARYRDALKNMGGDPEQYPLWGVTTKSAQYAAGNNASIQMMDDVGNNVRGHGSIIINTQTAQQLGIGQGERIEVRSIVGSTQGRAELVQGIRPDTVCIPGQFDYWKTPFAKDLKYPSLNTVIPMSLDLTDSTGSGADLVRVSIHRLGGEA